MATGESGGGPVDGNEQAARHSTYSWLRMATGESGGGPVDGHEQAARHSTYSRLRMATGISGGGAVDGHEQAARHSTYSWLRMATGRVRWWPCRWSRTRSVTLYVLMVEDGNRESQVVAL